MKKGSMGKKAAFLLGMSMMVSSVLSGCAGTADNTPTKEEAAAAGEVTHVVYWNLFSGDDGNVMVDLVDRFNEEHPDIYVENLTQDWGQYYTKLRTAVLGGVSPDIAISHKSRLIELKNNNIILPIEEEAKVFGIDYDYDKFSPASKEGVTFDDKNYAVPFDSMFMLLYYNKDILSQMNLLAEDGTPMLGEGMDGFINTLETVKANNPGIHPVESQCSSATLPRMWYTIYTQLTDQPFLSTDGKSLNLDSEAAEKATEMQKKIYEYVPIIEGNAGQLFQAEKAAFMINTTSVVAATEAVLGDKMGVIPFPVLGNTAASWTDSHTFILPVNDKRDEKTTKAALEFVKWMSENGISWAASGALPANQNLLDSDELQKLPGRTEYLDVTKMGSVFPSAENIWFSNSPDFVEPLENMIKNNASAKDTLSAFTERINAALAK